MVIIKVLNISSTRNLLLTVVINLCPHVKGIDLVNNVTMGPVKEGTVFDLTDDNQIEYVEDTFVEESWEDNKFLKPIYIEQLLLLRLSS